MQEKIICHLITGFLGAGKTHLIKQLAASKPTNERWVILVNEAGQQTYPSETLSTQGITVKMVLGGCLCCSAGMPFRVALNDMIKRHRPDRIFIEPAGAGHLQSIKELLQSPLYQSILALAKIKCLINPQHLSTPHYREHTLYLQLIAQSDHLLVVADAHLQLAQEMAKKHAKKLIIFDNNTPFNRNARSTMQQLLESE